MKMKRYKITGPATWARGETCNEGLMDDDLYDLEFGPGGPRRG